MLIKKVIDVDFFNMNDDIGMMKGATNFHIKDEMFPRMEKASPQGVFSPNPVESVLRNRPVVHHIAHKISKP